MAPDRLTRQELSWLLAQEARGASKALRVGVTQLKHPVGISIQPGESQVETTLDTLEDAIEMLSALQSGTAASGRRGRIDLAALLCSMAPNARIAIEPGAGTEVFGEENELSRMLHVLLSQTNSSPSETAETASPEVSIRREGDWVRVTVVLGPDSSSTVDLERRWLSRMATRHGGRLELDAGAQSIVLPADGATDRREVTELRKELEQAQQLGEAYARELAAVLSQSPDLPTTEPVVPPTVPAMPEFDLLAGMAGAVSRSLRDIVDGLRADVFQVGTPGAQPASSQTVERRLHAASDLALELTRVAQCRADEPPEPVDVKSLLDQVVSLVARRAARQGVQIVVQAPSSLTVSAPPQLLQLLISNLAQQAVLATPRDGCVALSAERKGGLRITVQDGGPGIPAASRADLVAYRADPTAFGRPGGIYLVVAAAAARTLGISLGIGEGPAGQTEVWVHFPQ